MTERSRSWPFGIAVFGSALALLALLDPPPGVFWFDFAWIAYNLEPLPLTFEGLSEAIRWQSQVHSSFLIRPARAVQWWLGVKAFGCEPLGYYVVNILGLALAVWAVTRVAERVTGSRRRALLAGGCLAVSYITAYSILFFGFGIVAACAFVALATYFASEVAEGWRRRAGLAVAVALLLVAGFSHETLLSFSLIPLAHAASIRRERVAVLRALVFLPILPVFLVGRAVMASIYSAAPPTVGSVLSVLRASPGLLAENSGRVLFATLTGGLPLDPLRALPVLPEFARLRELALSPVGILTLGLALAPTVALVALAMLSARGAAEARRRLAFYFIWLAMGSVPLMLPVGTPEAFHLTGALPALFLVWTEVFRSGASLGRRARTLAVVALVVWSGTHVTARWILFHRDAPAMTRAVRALHSVLLAAQLEGVEARVLFFPAQIGAHYGMMPTVPALYSDDPARGRACLRSDRPHGCLVEPIWVWSALRPWPALPGACLTRDGVRVGPLSDGIERELEGSRQMLSHPATTLGKQQDPKLLNACLLPETAPIAVGDDRYLLYRMDVSPRTRWYRFSLERGPELLTVADCGR